MIARDYDAVVRFLDSLRTTPRGRALAVNMLDSHKAGLCPTSNLRDFLVDCGRTLQEAQTRAVPADAVAIVEDVSSGHGVDKRTYLRQCRQSLFAPTDTHTLSNTLKTDTLWRFLVATRYKDPATSGLPVVLPPIPVNSPSGTLEYRKRLAEVTSDPAWYEPAATIGRPLPHPSNCWLTSDLFDPDTAAPKYPDDAATEARDQLGLIDYSDGTFLLRLTLAPSSLGALHGCEIARPTFSDLGNSRFQASQSSPRAAAYAARGWGATVHLGKFRAGLGEATGAAERVSTSLPLSALHSLRVDFLGPVKGERGRTKHDDDDAFAAHLEAGRSSQEIRDALLSLLT